MLNTYCGVERPAPGVARVTISGAGRANVLSTPVAQGLIAGLETLARDETLRVVVLTGSGDRTFIGGADLAEMATLEPESAQTFIRLIAALCEAVRTFPVPVVARIQGPCLGGGLELAAACDGRVAAPRATFSMPEVLVGVPSVIHAALLPRLIGRARAHWFILTGNTVDAETALAWGLVDHVAGPEGLDAAVEAAIAPILSCGPHVIRAQKALMKGWDELGLADAIEASVPVFGAAFATGEPQHHTLAFLAAKAGRAAKAAGAKPTG